MQARSAFDLSIASLQAQYSISRAPADIIDTLLATIALESWRIAWISLEERDVLVAAAQSLERRRKIGEALPLYGVPFGVKDHIDVAGMPTTVACPSPKRS